MSHPLLTKWLHDSMVAMGFGGWAAEVIVDEGSDPAIADRLEAALDVCAVCGFTQWSYVPREGPAIRTHPMGDGHPFVPLVTP